MQSVSSMGSGILGGLSRGDRRVPGRPARDRRMNWPRELPIARSCGPSMRAMMLRITADRTCCTPTIPMLADLDDEPGQGVAMRGGVPGALERFQHHDRPLVQFLGMIDADERPGRRVRGILDRPGGPRTPGARPEFRASGHSRHGKRWGCDQTAPGVPNTGPCLAEESGHRMVCSGYCIATCSRRRVRRKRRDSQGRRDHGSISAPT